MTEPQRLEPYSYAVWVDYCLLMIEQRGYMSLADRLVERRKLADGLWRPDQLATLFDHYPQFDPEELIRYDEPNEPKDITCRKEQLVVLYNRLDIALGNAVERLTDGQKLTCESAYTFFSQIRSLRKSSGLSQ